MTLHQPVNKVMAPRRVRLIGEFDSVATAVTLMDEDNISAMPVKNETGTHYIGVISKTDIASPRFLKLLQEKPADKIPVRYLMNRTPPIFVMETQPLSDVIALMHRHHIHRVFVSDAKHKICGLISTTDVIKLLFLERS